MPGYLADTLSSPLPFPRAVSRLTHGIAGSELCLINSQHEDFSGQMLSERIFSRLNLNFGIKLLMQQSVRREAVMIIWMGRGKSFKPQIPMNGSEFVFSELL